jgi:cytoskeleton protein RodZ
MAASFGEQLRLAREARGISLREISEQTRISTRYLEAIETEDFKRLPGGIFNRSFIKAYARYVGYDEKEALEAYARTAREMGAAGDEVATTPYKSHVYTDGGGTRSPLVTLLLAILILAILSLGVFGGLHWYKRRQAAGSTGNTPAPASQPATNNASAANNNPGAPAATTGFVIQLKALDRIVWVRSRVDADDSTDANLKPGEVKEFKPTQSLTIRYPKSGAKALEMTINGRPAKVTTTSTTNPVEMVITKDDYQKFLQ